mgnify:CR=1 FL=1
MASIGRSLEGGLHERFDQRLSLIRWEAQVGDIAFDGGLRLSQRGRIQLPLVGHLRQHQIATLQGTVGKLERVVVGRPPDQGDQQGHVMQLQLFQRAAEVVLARQPEAMDGAGAVLAQINFVEIELEDLVLTEGAVDAHR